MRDGITGQTATKNDQGANPQVKDYIGLSVAEIPGAGEREMRWYCKGLACGLQPHVGLAALRWQCQQARKTAESQIDVCVRWGGEDHDMTWAEFDAWIGSDDV